MTLNDGGAVAGWLAAIAAAVTFGYSRTDRAQDKRKEDAKSAAREVLDEENVKVRLNTMEIVLPRVEEKVNAIDRKLDDLLLSRREGEPHY